MKVFFFYNLSFAFFLILSVSFGVFLKNYPLQLIINRIFLVIEFSFLCFFYYNILLLKWRKYIGIFCISAFTTFSIYDFYVTKAGEFNFIPLVVECMFFLTVIVLYFYEKIKYSITTPIYNSPTFWISVAFLIYFSGNFFLFLFSISMFKNMNFKMEYTIIYGTVTIFKNIFLCSAIWVNANREDEKDNNTPIDVDLGTFNPLPNQNNH